MSIILSVRCSSCGAEFPVNAGEFASLGLTDIPKSCPACKDREQTRPDVTLSRNEIWSCVARIGSLPGEWAEVPPAGRRDCPAWRIIIKGKQWGASWSGRIDLWSVAPVPPAVGDIVYLAEMEARKTIAKQTCHGARSDFRSGTAVTYSYSRQIPLLPEGEELPEGVSLLEETRRYLRLDPAPGMDPEERSLVWATRAYKTTLKGLGRQTYSSMVGEPLRRWAVSGSCRTGRYGGEGWLAVVDPDHPVIVSGHGSDGEWEERIPPLVEGWELGECEHGAAAHGFCPRCDEP